MNLQLLNSCTFRHFQGPGGTLTTLSVLLTSVYLDEHAGLVVRVRRERLRLFGRDGRVAFDQRRHYAAGSLYTKGQWCHVQ